MVNDIAVQEFVKAIKEEPQDTNKTYNATVSKVDGEGVVWVNIHGSDKETPTSSTSTEVKRGDSVTVNWRNNKLYIGGNYSNPSAGIGTVAPSVNYVNDLIDKDISVASINAATGYIGDLTADNITTENIKATNGYIQHLVADDITAEDISASSGYIKDLESENITAENIIADHETVGSLDANYAHITNGVIDNAKIGYADVNNLNAHYAEIDMANVNNAWIDHGAMKKAEVFDGNVFDLSGDKATIKRIDASKINVANLRADNLVVRRINGQPVVGGYTLIDSNSPGYSSKNPKALGWYEFVNAQWVLSTDTTVDMTKAYYQEGNEVSLYDQAYIDGLENDLQQQIDGAVETFTGAVVPTLTNWPYTDWYDTSVTPIHDERAKHVGDIYYVVNSALKEGGYCYRFTYDKTTTSYDWVLIKDNDVTKALKDISELQTFESETTSWIDETDEGLETIRTNHTALSGRVDDVEETANAALPASTFETFESTTFTDLVDEVDEQSTTMTNMTTRLGLNSDGTQSATDIVAKESALEQTVNGISTRVSKTETKLIGMYATSSTAEGTAAKVATITPALPSGATWELGTGTIITVKFTNANTAASPTLNVNSKGAKAIKTYANGNLTEAEYKWKAGSTFTFTYNGTNWLMQDSSASVRMNSAETSITQTADSIISLASGSTTYTKPDGTTATSAIGTTVNQTANNVLIKATRDGASPDDQKAGGTTAAALINVAPDTVKIAANHVEINGTATFNAIKSSADAAYDSKGSASAVQTNLDNLEIGGRNLFINSEFVGISTTPAARYASEHWDGVNGSKIFTADIDGRTTLTATKGTSTGLYCQTTKLPYIAGETVKISLTADIYVEEAGTVSIGAYIASPGWKSIIKSQSGDRALSVGWNKLSVLLTLYNATYSGNVIITFFYTGATMCLYHPKLEKGNKATDWTPAPEDVQAEIDGKTASWVLKSGNASGASYSTILGYAAEGTQTTFTIDSSTPTTGIKAGDTVRLAYLANNMGTNGTIVYIVGTVKTTPTSATSITLIGHGLDTTVIDGGHILTGTIDANRIGANSISIGKFDSSTQTKVNNGDSALSKVNYYNRTCLVGNSTNTQTKYWRKFASYAEKRTYADPFIIFDVITSGDFGSGKRFGRLKAHVRTSSTGKYQYATLEWISRGEGIVLTDFVLAYKETSGTDVKVELWCRCPREYEGYRFNMVQEGDRLIASTSAMWTLHDSWTADGVQSITSGYTQVTSTDIDAARTTATTYITHIDNNGIRIHPSSTENNSVVINSDGMEVFKGGTGSANSVAKYGDTSRIGKVANDQSRIEISGTNIDFISRDSSGTDSTLRMSRTNNSFEISDTNGNVGLNLWDSTIDPGYSLGASVHSNDSCSCSISGTADRARITGVYNASIWKGLEYRITTNELTTEATLTFEKRSGTPERAIFMEDSQYNPQPRKVLSYDASNNCILGQGQWTANKSGYNTYVEGYETNIWGRNKIATNMAITQGSDKRLKKDIKDLEDVKDFVMDLKPVEFKYEFASDKDKHLGFIAQDVERSMDAYGLSSDKYGLITEITGTDNIQYKGLNYTEFIPICIKMIQEQQQEIDALKEALNEVLGN